MIYKKKKKKRLVRLYEAGAIDIAIDYITRKELFRNSFQNYANPCDRGPNVRLIMHVNCKSSASSPETDFVRKTKNNLTQ